VDSKQSAELQGRLDEILTGHALAGSPPHASATVCLLALILDELRGLKAHLKPEPVKVENVENAVKVEAVDPDRRKPGRPPKGRP
jgi:hypothetical protein